MKETAEQKCIICGQDFTLVHEGDVCCSPFCRTILRTREIEAEEKKEADGRREVLEGLTEPPKFNLRKNPKARAEWFASLPSEYKPKFSRFLSPADLEWIKAIAQKDMAEERMLSGFYVKNGKIVETKKPMGKNDGEHDEGNLADGDEDDEMID